MRNLEKVSLTFQVEEDIGLVVLEHLCDQFYIHVLDIDLLQFLVNMIFPRCPDQAIPGGFCSSSPRLHSAFPATVWSLSDKVTAGYRWGRRTMFVMIRESNRLCCCS